MVGRGRLPALLALALLPGLAPRGALADIVAVRAELEPAVVGLDEPLTLTLEVSGTWSERLALEPSFDLEGLAVVRGPVASNRYLFLQGATTRSTRLTWTLRPLAAGRARVRAIRLRVEGRVYELPDRVAQVRPGAPPPRPRSRWLPDPLEEFERRRQERSGRHRRGVPLEPRVFLQAEVSPARPYVGQQLVYTVWLFTQATARHIQPESLPDFRGFWVREIPHTADQRAEPVAVEGEPFHRVLLFRRALFPLGPGAHEIAPVRMSMMIQAAEGEFAPLFSRFREEQRSSNPVTVAVRPLPPPPPGFTGAVGDLSLDARLEPSRVAVGDAATLTLTLAGRGHIQGLPGPEVPELPGLKILPPQQEGQETVRGTAVEGLRRWRFLVVPERPGRFRLPAVSLPYFDPGAGEYRLATTGEIALDGVDRAAAAESATLPAGLHPIRSAILPGAGGGWRAALPWLFAVPWTLAVLLLLARHRGRRAAGPATPEARLEAQILHTPGLKPRQAALDLEAAWASYLGQRWQLPSDSPLSQWTGRLAEAGAPGEVIEELGRLVEDLHYLRQAPQLSVADALVSAAAERSLKLLRHLG